MQQRGLQASDTNGLPQPVRSCCSNTSLYDRNMRNVPQASPAAPLFPSTGTWLWMVEPTKTVKAAISMRPPPKIEPGYPALLAIVGTGSLCSGGD